MLAFAKRFLIQHPRTIGAGSLASSSVLIPIPEGETFPLPAHLFRFLIHIMGTGIPNPGIYLRYLLIINHANGTDSMVLAEKQKYRPMDVKLKLSLEI